jgi:NAD+ kinase
VVSVLPQPARLALVVHPTRPIEPALATLTRWAAEHELDVVQLAVPGSEHRPVAAPGDVRSGDLVVALGGDGTVLSALRASIAASVPVIGVACGSLGVLTAVPSAGLADALGRVLAGDWTPRRLPALAIQPADGPDDWAVNDLVVVRGGAGQLLIDVFVDEELYVRLAGDGLIVATPLGSSAYSMAAGGPVLALATAAVVCTPLAMHGGSAAPIVVPSTSRVHLKVHPSFNGFGIELDGHAQPFSSLAYHLSLHDDKVTLVSFGKLGLGLAGLRARRLIIDSARVLARDARAAEASKNA